MLFAIPPCQINRGLANGQKEVAQLGTFQPAEVTPVHLAALQIEDAIALLVEMVETEVCSPKVGRLERCVCAVLKERDHLRKALEADDTERTIVCLNRLSKKVFRALRIFNSCKS